MPELRDAGAWRGPSTSDNRARVYESIHAERAWASGQEGVDLSVDIPVTTGASTVHITFGPGDYETILGIMVRADRKAALGAMAAVLAEVAAAE